MVEYAKLTGKVDKRSVEVRIRTGEHLYAPVMLMGTNVTFPSEEWISSNKDNFLALVTYEKDRWDAPLILGFFPVKSAKSEEYNSTERLLEVTYDLIKMLTEAKVNTQIGPQPFLPPYIKSMNDYLKEIEKIRKQYKSL